MKRNNGLEASLPNPNTSYCYNKNKQYPRSIHSTKAPEKKLSYHNYGWVHSYGWVTWLGSRAQSQQQYRKIPNPNTSSCYNEKKQYHRSLDPQSNTSYCYNSPNLVPNGVADNVLRHCFKILLKPWPDGMRVSDPPPPPGHGVMDSQFKFLTGFAKS